MKAKLTGNLMVNKVRTQMKKLLSLLSVLIVAVLLMTSCGNTATRVPTSTVPVPTATPTPSATATLPPSGTATNELPISPEASAYLEEALDIMQNKGINRLQLDWEAVRAEAFRRAQHAQTPADTYSAIRYALREAGGQHSSFRTPDSAAQVQQATVSDSPAPRGKLLLGKFGFIAIEGFESVMPEEQAKYATTVQQLIRDLDAQDPCGWIIDLREDTGGSTWPMLAGLGPILGEGKAGAFVDPDGYEEDWSYQDGQALLGDEVVVKVNGPAYELKAASPPVAVLTGAYTASAGEAIVVAFRGRPHTRSFGLYTFGNSTANEVFLLSDGAWIALTTAVYADRTGQTYGDRIYPDELVDEARKFTFIMEEAIPQPAIDWLMSQPACTVQK